MKYKLAKPKIFSLKKQSGRMDFILLGIVIFLSLFGLLMIFEASYIQALQEYNDKYHFLRNQTIWLGLAVVSMALVSRIEYRNYYHLSIFLLLGALALLFAVFIPGLGTASSGAHRWINLGFIQFQPTEIVKLVLVVYLSAWFRYQEKGRFLAFLILLALIVGLIILEPDLGTAVVVGSIATALYFLSGAPIWQFLILIPIGLAGILGLSLVSPYRYRRLMTFFNPQIDPLGASYHIRQLLLALGRGGWFGVGIGKSRQKFNYLPEATTDSIFAIIGEEFGFIGSSIILLLLTALVLRGFKIAQNSSTRFGKLLAGGISAWFAIQIIINLGAIAALLPLTGMPLPFISYGGSSLVIIFIAVGILLNISKEK